MFKFLKYRKSSLLKKRKIATRAMILDEEITIEVYWRILNEVQEKTEGFKKEIKENLKEIKAEKEKTPMDMEKIKALNSENVKLGWTIEKDKNGNSVYGRGSKIFSGLQQANYYHGEIDKVVGKREYLKIQLRAISRMIETGYMKQFEDIIKSEAQVSFQGKK